MTQDEANTPDTQKFLLSDDVRIVDGKEVPEVVFTGLSKEEIMAYGKDPKWVRIRWIIFALFWIIWFGMLIAAALLIVFSPRCAPRPKQYWWMKEVVYQLDVPTFRDSDKDSHGDIGGVIEKLKHFEELGVKTLSINYILNQKKELDPLYSDDETMLKLRKELNMRDMHLIMRVPANNLLEKDEEFLKKWLTNYMDGIHITETTAEKIDDKKYKNWKEVVKKISKKTFKEKFIAFDDSDGNVTSDVKFFNGLENVATQRNTQVLDQITSIYNETDKKNIWPALKLSNMNGESNNKLIFAMSLLLKGTPFISYGNELESPPGKYMKWNNDVNSKCGFSDNATKTEIIDCEQSVQVAFAHGVGQTKAGAINKITKLRELPAFSWGDVLTANESTANVISFIRSAIGFEKYLVAACKNTQSTVDFKEKHNITEKGKIAFFYSTDNTGVVDFVENKTVATDRIYMKPGQLLVLQLEELKMAK